MKNAESKNWWPFSDSVLDTQGMCYACPPWPFPLVCADRCCGTRVYKTEERLPWYAWGHSLKGLQALSWTESQTSIRLMLSFSVYSPLLGMVILPSYLKFYLSLPQNSPKTHFPSNSHYHVGSQNLKLLVSQIMSFWNFDLVFPEVYGLVVVCLTLSSSDQGFWQTVAVYLSALAAHHHGGVQSLAMSHQ